LDAEVGILEHPDRGILFSSDPSIVRAIIEILFLLDKGKYFRNRRRINQDADIYLPERALLGR